MQKRLDQADAELDVALELPDSTCRTAMLWRKRGYILFDRGKLVDSYRAYAHWLDLDAGSPLARNEMNLIVKTLHAAGTYDEKALAPLVAAHRDSKAPPSPVVAAFESHSSATSWPRPAASSRRCSS